MKNIYRRTKTTVSLIHYHFVFCPRYRRKIFDIDGVEERFKELVAEVLPARGIDILAAECHHDHVHLFVSCLPSVSPAEVMKTVKGATANTLRKEFIPLSRMPSLWTRSYFVSTAGNVSSETIAWYVSTQKTKG